MLHSRRSKPPAHDPSNILLTRTKFASLSYEEAMRMQTPMFVFACRPALITRSQRSLCSTSTRGNCAHIGAELLQKIAQIFDSASLFSAAYLLPGH